MSSYLALKTLIEKGNYKLGDIVERLTNFAAMGEISLEEKSELENLARGKANAGNEIDLTATVLDLVARVRALEEAKKPQQPEDDPEQENEPEEFVIGKWYYRGDRVKFNGKNYKCIAPEGVVCVWSPTDYPAYWEAED